MGKVENIKRQIETLTQEDLSELRSWFWELDWKIWDVQIAADEKAGKLNALIDNARSEYKK